MVDTIINSGVGMYRVKTAYPIEMAGHPTTHHVIMTNSNQLN